MVNFNPTQLENLKLKWKKNPNDEVIKYFSPISNFLAELKKLEINELYKWIDFSTTVLITIKDFSSVEMIIKQIIYTKSFKQLNNSRKANLHNKLGVSYGFRGAFQKAIECYQYVYDLALSKQDVGLFPRACNNLGINYMHLDKLSRAEEILKEGLDKLKEIESVDEKIIENRSWEIMLRGNLAELLRRKRSYQQSIIQAKTVLELAKMKASITPEELIEVQSETLKTLFLSYFEMNNFDEIESVMDQINSMIFLPNSQFGFFYYFLIHGFYDWLVKSKLESAEEFFRQSLSVALKVEAGEFVYQAQLFLAQILIEMITKNFDESSKIINTNLEEIENILKEISSFSKSQKMFGVLAETLLLQAEFFRCTYKYHIAYQYLSYSNVIINSNNLNHLSDRYNQIESRLQNQLENNQTSHKSGFIDFGDLVKYLTEIHKIFKVQAS